MIVAAVRPDEDHDSRGRGSGSKVYHLHELGDSISSIHQNLLADDSHALVIPDRATIEQIQSLRLSDDKHLLPVISLIGEIGRDLDYSVDANVSPDLQKLTELFEGYRTRKNTLPYAARVTDNDEIRMLAYLHVGDRKLLPNYAPERAEGVSYGLFLPVEKPRAVAEELSQKGFLKRRHFDRVHSCDNCGSARLNVREECHNCRSPNISEARILHHLSCAFQGQEREFADGDHLICPKCSTALRHYGSDYETTGHMICCENCGERNAEPLVGFVCMDCHVHADAEKMSTIEYFAYELTASGIEFLKSYTEPKERSVNDSLGWGVPLAIVREIQEMVSSSEKDQAVFVLCELTYANERELSIEHGATVFARLRNQFLENMRNFLGDDGLVRPARHCDYILVRGVTKKILTEHVDKFLGECTRALKFDPGAKMEVFDAAEVLRS